MGKNAIIYPDENYQMLQKDVHKIDNTNIIQPYENSSGKVNHQRHNLHTVRELRNVDYGVSRTSQGM